MAHKRPDKLLHVTSKFDHILLLSKWYTTLHLIKLLFVLSKNKIFPSLMKLRPTQALSKWTDARTPNKISGGYVKLIASVVHKKSLDNDVSKLVLPYVFVTLLSIPCTDLLGIWSMCYELVWLYGIVITWSHHYDVVLSSDDQLTYLYLRFGIKQSHKLKHKRQRA